MLNLLLLVILLKMTEKEELQSIMKLSQQSFSEWDNRENEIYLKIIKFTIKNWDK